QSEKYLSTLNAEVTHIELAFYGGSFTGIPPQQQIDYLSVAQGYLLSGRIHGIRLSTRPDYINEEVIKRLKYFGVGLVELGVQSLDEEVLVASKRGYHEEVVAQSVQMLHSAGILVGIQLMIGLPKDTLEKVLTTVEKVIQLQPVALRIYPTLVIQDTLLQTLYEEGVYEPLDLETAVEWTAKMARRFYEEDIPIIRMGLQPTEWITEGQSVIAGPFHPAFRQLVESRLLRDEIMSWLKQQQKEHSDDKNFIVSCNRFTQSILIGQKRKNIEFFQSLGYHMVVNNNEKLAKGKIELSI
ncbi:MAG: radical SAM protein, partial [Vallitaleaceae bacterium]|nr:radical SAM protein [Vallitaleaceae bacterium]